jgi:uncharacterized caspase-like protein
MKRNTLLAVCALAAVLALAGCSNISASSAAANRYAIVIGVGTYASGGTCSYADNDAYNMAALLKKEGWTVNENEYQQLISSSSSSMQTTYNPTMENIETAILKFSSINSNSTILVYFSGHGAISSDGSTGYIAPYDGTASYDASGNIQYSNCITAATLTKWIGALPCMNKVLILDSCYSGAFVDTGSSVDASPQDSNTISGSGDSSILASAVGNLSTLLAASVAASGDPDVLTISACGSGEESYSGTTSMKDGVFTYYLLQAANSGDTDGDGYVTCTEALAYTKKMIKANWNKQNAALGEALLPHISGGTGDLVLFDNN